MAYDGLGTFVRLHNWTQDAANGVDINAPEMDGEDNGFAAGLSLAVTRDGQGKMQVDFLPNADNTLNLGTNARRWASINGVPIGSITSGIFVATTTAEIAAAITPTVFTYFEGDIRRYGALTANADNHVAITAALSVSAAGGNPAFIPGGTWKTTAAVTAAAGSSMYGVGTASILNSANGIDGIQFTAADAGIVARSRSFRDFQIQGTLSGTANAAKGININSSVISHCKFENLSILNFQYGIFSQGLYYSTIFACFIQNCYQGIYFNNQSINVFLLDNTIQLTSGGTLITASGSSQGISCAGAPEIEGLHIQGGSIYGFNYGINLGLVFECQINAVDIAFSTICPVFFTSTIGGLVIRDCWLELASTASGTWNTGGTGTGNLTGIFIGAITPSTITKVHIHGNEILSDVAIGGSTALYLGNSNNGISVTDNHMLGFDIGIGGGNTLNNIGGSLAGATIKGNTINVTTSGILLNNGCTELELGPNYIVSGAQVAFTSTAPTSMVYQQPNVPMKGTAAFAAATTAAVAFTNPMAFATYRIALSQSATSTLPPWYTAKTVNGFTINFSVAFTGNVDWVISA